MRHAARLPLPPVFNDRRLLLLIAFCKLQNIDHSSCVCILFCVWILHVSADICMFLMFAANSLRVGRRWESANINASLCPKYTNNYAKINQNSCNIHPKSSKIIPKDAPKATLGASLFLVTKKAPPSLRNGCHLSATWATLGVILLPAGRQGVPKIESFGIKSY